LDIAAEVPPLEIVFMVAVVVVVVVVVVVGR